MTNQDQPSTPELEAALAQLPRSIQPERNLWPAIAQRLPPRASAPAAPRHDRWALALAAAALLAIGMGLGYMLRGAPARPLLVGAGGDPASHAAPTAVGLATTDHAAGLRGIEALAAYRAATAELRSDLALRGAYLEPQTRTLVQRELAVIESAIAEIERAFAASPADPHLERMLLTRYRQQVDLLTRWLPVGTDGAGLGREELVNEDA